MKHPNEIIKAVLQSEKGLALQEKQNRYSLRVDRAANKAEIKKAVQAGYWQLYRYNPDNENPMTVDSKAPTASYQEFIKGENRYASLLRQFPDVAPELFAEAQKDAEDRLASYQRLAAE